MYSPALLLTNDYCFLNSDYHTAAMSVMVASVTPAKADADTDRPAPAGFPVFFQHLVFFVHYGKTEGLACRKAADFHLCQDVGPASGYAVDPLFPLFICIDRGIFL